MSVETGNCPECGAELLAAGTGFVCGQCLLGAALGESSTVASTEASSRELTLLLAKPTPALGVKFHYFGDYELLEEIARGGMGVVFRARQVSLDRLVAVKMIVGGQLASKEAVNRFQTEARAAARLDHPNIVPIYEVGEHDGLHYFSMKLIEGGSLGDAIHEGPTPSRDAARLMGVISRAVDHAHQRCVLHRDLKPSNILLDQAGEPHITDFGLAKVVNAQDAVPSATVVGGTPAYAAPEQALNGKATGPSADIYSLGVILYKMLSGRLPFPGNTPLEIARKASEELPASVRDRVRGIDGDLEAICFKCLHNDPRQRYVTAGSLAEDLEKWLRGEPIGVRRTTAVARARRWMQRRPALAALVMLSVLMATAVPLLVQKIRAAREEKDEFVSSVLNEKIRELHSLRKQWARLDVPFVSISSELRSEIWKARSSVSVPDIDPERYSVGIYAHENPVEAAGQFAPFLAALENSLSSARSNRVRLDLRIYKDNRTARQALVHRVVDIVRLGAGPFLVAQEELAERGETVEVLARARPGNYTAVIFARADTGIKSVGELKGRALALGDPESTISGFHVPALLAEAGLSAREMRVEFHSSHNDAVSQVLRGRFDAGVAKTSLFESRKSRPPGLLALTNVTCISMPWVARSKLHPEVVALFRKSLLAVHDRAILEALPDKPVDGFEPATAEEYAGMRAHRQNAERFLGTVETGLARSGVLGGKSSREEAP